MEFSSARPTSRVSELLEAGKPGGVRLNWRSHFICSDTCYMLHVTCYMLHVTCYMLQVTSYMLHATCYKLHVTCYMLHVTSYMFHATCYKLHVTCYMLQVTCYMLQVTCYVLHYILPLIKSTLLNTICHHPQDVPRPFKRAVIKPLLKHPPWTRRFLTTDRYPTSPSCLKS